MSHKNQHMGQQTNNPAEEQNAASQNAEEQTVNAEVEEAVETENSATEAPNAEEGETNQTETIESLQERIVALETERESLKESNLRMMAEFDNYRKRTNKEKLDLLETAGERIFKDMLPLVDDFERAEMAVSKSDDIEAHREGLKLIFNKFIQFLEKNHVVAIDTTDAVFDTELHEAITTFPAPSPEQKGKVIDCTQKGYKLGEKVIRYAKVVVGE